MTVIPDILAQLARLDACANVPRVKALHLPPPHAVAASRIAGRGEFCALELTDGTLGLAYVLLDDHSDALREGQGLDGLVGASALDIARGLLGPQGVNRVLGWAAVNAMTRWLYDRAGYVPPESRDSFGQLPIVPGERIGMVGFFTPLIDRVLAAGARLTVVELRTDLEDARPGLRLTNDPAELEGCTKVLCTSTVLINDTLDATLAHCRDARWFAMVGPSAGCLPDALFARGVTMVGGTWVTDPAACLSALMHGEALKGGTRKFAIERVGWPGFDALLALL